MCFEEGKIRFQCQSRPRQLNSQPLIKDKRHTLDLKEKQNQKYNPPHHSRIRQTQNQQHSQYQAKSQSNAGMSTNYSQLQERNQHQHQNLGQLPHNGKLLTFGNIKNNALKNKECVLQQQMVSYNLIPEHKRILNIAKNQSEKEKTMLTDRSERPLAERVAEMKEKVQSKVTHPKNTFLLVDLGCSQQLECKPVQKKSLIPQKNYISEKTTSKFDFPTKSRKKDRKNQGRDLKQFQNIQTGINSTTQSQSLLYFCQRQEQYMVDPVYIDKTQKLMTWWSRSIVIDWMRHISYEFSLQRDTYHIAVVLLDNYLANTTNIPKTKLQAIAATTLFIASKLEEFQCRQSSQFAKSTNNSCSIEDIHELQISIVKCLRFKINPPTLFALVNQTVSQWDIFMQAQMCLHPLFQNQGHIPIFFKQLDQNSYKMFRQLMQLIDCAIIDAETLQYKPKMLVCSFLYLLIGRQLDIFSNQQILNEFPHSSLFLLDQDSYYNDLFHSFLFGLFGFQLLDLLPTAQYASTFLHIAFTYQMPMLTPQHNLQTMSLQQYSSYQTYNSGMLRTIKTRSRTSRYF